MDYYNIKYVDNNRNLDINIYDSYKQLYEWKLDNEKTYMSNIIYLENSSILFTVTIYENIYKFKLIILDQHTSLAVWKLIFNEIYDEKSLMYRQIDNMIKIINDNYSKSSEMLYEMLNIIETVIDETEFIQDEESEDESENKESENKESEDEKDDKSSENEEIDDLFSQFDQFDQFD